VQTFSIVLVYCLIPFAALLGVLAVKFLDRLRGRDADAEAKMVVEQAHLEIANRKKEAELEIKEASLREKERLEQEQKVVRDQLDERERLLNRQKEANEQRAEQLAKQERAVEGTQRRLSERLAETDRRSEELAKLLDIERQTLHQVTGLSKQDATAKLLEILERELSQEAGQLIQRQKKAIADTCGEYARDMLLTALQRYASQRRNERQDHRPRRAEHPRV
jgi:ribonuclease Y